MTQLRGDGVGQWPARQRETAHARSALDAQTAAAQVSVGLGAPRNRAALGNAEIGTPGAPVRTVVTPIRRDL